MVDGPLGGKQSAHLAHFILLFSMKGKLWDSCIRVSSGMRLLTNILGFMVVYIYIFSYVLKVLELRDLYSVRATGLVSGGLQN